MCRIPFQDFFIIVANIKLVLIVIYSSFSFVFIKQVPNIFTDKTSGWDMISWTQIPSSRFSHKNLQMAKHLFLPIAHASVRGRAFNVVALKRTRLLIPMDYQLTIFTKLYWTNCLLKRAKRKEWRNKKIIKLHIMVRKSQGYNIYWIACIISLA